MPLTTAEIEFLAVYAREYTGNDFGVACRKLREAGIHYSDVAELLDAYLRTHPPSFHQGKDADGKAVELMTWGVYRSDAPELPWPYLEAVRNRNEQMLAERGAPAFGQTNSP